MTRRILNHVKTALLLALFAFVMVAPISALSTPQPASAACDARFLGMPAWYRGDVISNNDCTIKGPKATDTGLSTYIWAIVLNIIEIALWLVGYIAVGMIIYGGFMYITNGSEPQAVAKAWHTILQAMIGLVISLGAIGIVNLIVGIL